MKAKKSGSIRIIAGKWRGRRLPVPDLPGLRPTGDRARETLFSWLQSRIRGARCVDLFAGSGSLGLEAASRGAARVTLVESSRIAAQGLRDCVSLLDAEGVEVAESDAIAWLQEQAPASMDVIFIDPPFGSGLEAAALQTLIARGCLDEQGLVYLETDRRESVPVDASAWEVHREKVLGDVRMRLLKKAQGSGSV